MLFILSKNNIDIQNENKFDIDIYHNYSGAIYFRLYNPKIIAVLNTLDLFLGL